MTVPKGKITLPEAYDIHYANRFGAAPTEQDAEQAAAGLDDGTRKDAILKRQLGLTDEDANPDPPSELLRWRQFIHRQELIQREILEAICKGVVEVFVSEGRIVREMWRDHPAPEEVLRSGQVNVDRYQLSKSWQKLSGTYPYIDRSDFLAWSNHWISLGGAVKADKQLLFANFPDDPGAGSAGVSKRKWQSPQQERARGVAKRLYPGGVPPRSEMTDTTLVKTIQDEFSGKNVPSRDTVLRAVERAK